MKKPGGKTSKDQGGDLQRSKRHLWWRVGEKSCLAMYVQDGAKWRETCTIWKALLSPNSKDHEDLMKCEVPKHPVHQFDIIGTCRALLEDIVHDNDGKVVNTDGKKRLCQEWFLSHTWNKISGSTGPWRYQKADPETRTETSWSYGRY